MTEIKKKLFQAFKSDHALLGGGFYTLASCVRNKDISGAKSVATKINIDAGPHIAFEEEVFYPALKRFIEESELTEMYNEHELGRALLEKILALDESAELQEDLQKELLAEIDVIESHITECGELFGTMGRLNEQEMEHLYEKLKSYQLLSPNWLSRAVGSKPF